MSKKLYVVVYLFLVCLIALTTPAVGEMIESGGSAQGILDNQNTENTESSARLMWGTTGYSAKAYHSFGFIPAHSNMEWTFANTSVGVHRYCNAGTNCFFTANLDLPTGAKLVGLEIDFCDNTATGAPSFTIVRDGWGTGNEEYYYTYSGSVAGTPGCYTANETLPTPLTIRNWDNGYWLEVYLNEQTANLTFGAARIVYQLQLSPAPSTATFWDVPVGAPFFQEIEALADAGITSGFGDGSFRPNQNVSRAAVAAWLSKALGLHWPY